ncbi:MAG: hypothetical protein ABUL58_00625 [Steroidobacter sp.]
MSGIGTGSGSAGTAVRVVAEADDVATKRELLDIRAEDIEDEARAAPDETLVISTLDADELSESSDRDGVEIDEADSETGCADVSACCEVFSDDEQPINPIVSSEQARIACCAKLDSLQC